MIVKFIVLACSYKHGGRCVAGIDLNKKELIRLLFRDESTNFAIPKSECQVNDRYLLPLDIIEVDITEKAPTIGAQTENYYVSSPFIKSYIGRATEADIKQYLFKDTKLPYPFGTKDPFLSSGSYYYRNYSLCLIRAYALSLDNIINSEGNAKTKLSFDVYKFNGEKVRLIDYSVTDPLYTIFEGQNRAGKNSLRKAYLLISLGQEEKAEHYYKFVSGIIDCSDY